MTKRYCPLLSGLGKRIVRPGKISYRLEKIPCMKDRCEWWMEHTAELGGDGVCAITEIPQWLAGIARN